MIEEKNKPQNFWLYRYQIFVSEPFQPELYGIEEKRGIKTSADLKAIRNNILRGIIPALPNTKDNRNHCYQITSISEDRTQFLLTAEAQRSRKVMQNRTPKNVPHQPWAWIAIDTDDDVQTIAIAPVSDMRQDTINRVLTSNLQRILKKKGLDFVTHSIKRDDGFWEYVQENKGALREVTFTVSPPNMPGISTTVGSQLTELIKSTQAKQGNISLKAPRGATLELHQGNTRLRNFVDHVNKGGGDYSFLRKGSTKKDTPKNIQKSIVATPHPTVQLFEVDIDSPAASILTKIRVDYKITAE